MSPSPSHPIRLVAMLMLLSVLAISACTHHAGVLKTHQQEVLVPGTEEIPAASPLDLQVSADVTGIGKDGTLRGSATATVEGTVEYEISSHEVAAEHGYDFFEGTIWRAIAAPFYFGLLLPFTSDSAWDYGGDGNIGFGDRLLTSAHVLNPLMAWPFGARTEGEDTVLATRRERRPATLAAPFELQLELTSSRDRVTLPVRVAGDGAFAVELLPTLEQVWAVDLVGVLRSPQSPRVFPLRGLATAAGSYLAAIGRREPVDWAAARAADTRAAYREFIAEYRGSAHAAEVSERLHDLDWRDAEQAGDAPGYNAFLAKHPRSHRRNEALIRIEELDWQQATEKDTIASFTVFLAQHTDGVHTAAARIRLDDLQAKSDWQRAERRDTLDAYREFAANHPTVAAADTARERIEQLQAHADGWEAVCRVGTAEAFSAYRAANPGGPYAGAAARALQDLKGRDIFDLLEEGKVEVRTSGSSIQSIHVEVRRLAPYPLEVRIPVGSYFVSARQSAQNMVATHEERLQLVTNEWRHVTVSVACANKPKAIPGQSDSFTVERPQHLAELARLMPVLDAAKASYPTRQAAVWIVTDDASYGGLGDLVSRPAGAAFGGTRMIGPMDTARAIRLCADAGVDVRGKRILADRDAFLPDVADGELRSWLAALVATPLKARDRRE